MPAYNFKRQFAPKVEDGTKRQTIRRPRKRPTKVGDTLYLYVGQRTRHCRRLRVETCIAVTPILIMGLYNITIFPKDNALRRALSPPEINELARADGFQSANEFVKFFWKELPFMGEMIQW